MSDSNSLIPITDEQAKLGQELVKVFRGIGAFLEKALGSTPEDLIGYFGGDRLRVRRAENMAKMLYEARERLATWGVDRTEPATLSVALPILQAAADEDREEIVDLWARLLANAMDPALRNVRYAFIEAVKKMDPLDARILRLLDTNSLTSINPGDSEYTDSRVTSEGQLARSMAIRISALQVSISNLESAGFLWVQGRNKHVTSFFKEFMVACYPESVT